MRFCPQCGTPVVAGGKFCVGCGTALDASASVGAGGRTDAPAAADIMSSAASDMASTLSASRVSPAFAAVFGGILVVGLAASVFILRKLPQHQQELASAASRATTASNLPPGHPQLKLPDEARKLIADIQAKAEAAPNDVAAWNRLGQVAERAAMFDQAYYATAERAFAHALKLDPDNLDALRGTGNLDYDRHRYDEAIAAYEHYLDRKPDDPRVRTDLGTMYLSSGNADLAMVEYKKVIAKHPKFFEAYFNLGVAYAEQEDKPTARSYFLKARELAPDDRTRSEIDQMLATVGGVEGGETAVAAQAGAAGSASGESAATFKGAFERMVRALPIAGAKVHAVQWTGDDQARMLMDNFPMDQMPPFAAKRFLDDLRSGTRDLMSDHHVAGPVTVEIADAASNRVMRSLTVDADAAAPSNVASAASAPSSSATFQDAVAAMMRNLPVAGRKVAAVQWASKTRARVMMDNFPMGAMPPFARDKFIADIKAGLQTAKAAHNVTGTVTVDLADAQSGRVMESVSE